MKPTSGRASSVAKLAATAFATAALGLAASVLPVVPAFAQVSTATADSTPAIDAAITSKDWASALTQLDARIKSNPRDVQAKFKRATVLARLDRDDEAISAFTALTETYPELPEPYNNLAALYAKKGRYEDARVALETAVKANPSYGLAYENLGDLYLRLASESYKRAQALGSRSPLTAQRVSDIQKIVSPPVQTGPEAAAAAAAARKASGASGTPAASPSDDWSASPSPSTGLSSGSEATTPAQSPLFSPFNNPSVPLSTTPYMAPGNQ
jgi:tetratricopeptide (TPR) repeat protein